MLKSKSILLGILFFNSHLKLQGMDQNIITPPEELLIEQINAVTVDIQDLSIHQSTEKIALNTQSLEFKKNQEGLDTCVNIDEIERNNIIQNNKQESLKIIKTTFKEIEKLIFKNIEARLSMILRHENTFKKNNREDINNLITNTIHDLRMANQGYMHLDKDICKQIGEAIHLLILHKILNKSTLNLFIKEFAELNIHPSSINIILHSLHKFSADLALSFLPLLISINKSIGELIEFSQHSISKSRINIENALNNFYLNSQDKKSLAKCTLNDVYKSNHWKKK